MDSFVPVLLLLFVCVFTVFNSTKNFLQKQSQTPQSGKSQANSRGNTKEQSQEKPVEQFQSGEGFDEDPSVRERALHPTIRFSGRDDSVYQGSMNAVTGEGEDPCHDEQLSTLNQAKDRIPASPDPEAAILQGSEPQPGFSFRWNGDEVVRGLVMSEILKRKSFR